METSRCTELILKGIYHSFDEMWVSHQPFLLTTYTAQYFPYLNRILMTKVAGPSRVNAIKSGRDVYDLKVIFFSALIIY